MKRLFLVSAAAALLAWLAWLAFAVSKAGSVPIVSRAQLTAATDLVVADVSEDPSDPSIPAREIVVVEVISGDNLKSGEKLEVDRMGSARAPVKGFPVPGRFLVPIAKSGMRYRVAGIPRSPGVGIPSEKGDTSDDFAVLPRIYPWVEEVKVQLRTLGYSVK